MILLYFADYVTYYVMDAELEAELATVVWMYTDQHLTIRQIAQFIDLSPTTVTKFLKLAGIGRQQGTYVGVKCALCGRAFRKPRSLCRNQRNHFCSREHWGEWLRNPDYIRSPAGLMTARRRVKKLFKLRPRNVVHHKDGNNRNNELANLAVYATQSDHLRHHHGDPTAKPIWDGSQHVVVTNANVP